nr:subclass B3 metallo-beta-lactamase [Taibaiella koreensis]
MEKVNRHNMSKSLLSICLILICLSGPGERVWAQQVQEPANAPPEWSRPYKPFCIAGNLYYVGTCELACYLLTTPQGHILINTGLASSVEQIKANVATLGFKLSDISILLTTQAHYDHTGAMAALKEMTGARFMADEKDAGVLEDGGRSDYAFSRQYSSFRPIGVDRLLKNKDTINLGGASVTMLHHPGHTKGSCSFLFTVKDEHRSYTVLIANMPSIVTEKKFSELKTYPEIAKDYAYTLDAMKAISFDIWLASHACQFDLQVKHKPGDNYNPAAFIDRKGYDAALKALRNEFDEKLEKE